MANCYDKFDEETNNGVLLDYDISGQVLKPEVLTAEEMRERTDWKAMRENLYDHNGDKVAPSTKRTKQHTGGCSV